MLNILCIFFGVNVYLANALAIGLVTVWNFWLNTSLAWRTADVEHKSPPALVRLRDPSAAQARSKTA